MDEITKQITKFFYPGENYLDEARLYDPEGRCDCELVLSDSRLFIYRYARGNADVLFYAFDRILGIEETKDGFGIEFLDGSAHSFEYVDEKEARRFMASAREAIAPALSRDIRELREEETEKEEKWRRRALAAMIAALAAAALFLAGYAGYRYSRSSGSGGEEQSENEGFSETDAMAYQISFMRAYSDRLASYESLIADMEGTLAAASGEGGGETFLEEAEGYGSAFSSVKISEEDMQDYGIAIEQDEGYIAAATEGINLSIESAISMMYGAAVDGSLDEEEGEALADALSEAADLVASLLEAMETEEGLLLERMSSLN